jgi:hypothetical protein
MNEMTTLSTLTNGLPVKWIEKMFDEMHLTHGKKFVDLWASTDPDKLIDYWSQEMASYTGLEIRKGLDAQKKLDWPPTLAQFKKLCRPDIDHMKAYYEALAGVQARAIGKMGDWSHPAIYWAAMPLTFDLNNQTFSQIRARWERALDEQMEKGKWEPIPQPMIALPEPGKGKLSKENAEKMINELGAVGVLKPKNDDLRWMKRILTRIEKKDKTLTLIQIQFATQAQKNIGARK